jgi:RNA polymerase sigma-70 factor (ECF subfamily)
MAFVRVHAWKGLTLMGLSGTQRVIEQLVADHYESLFRYAYRLSGSAVDAEDLTQEAFCKAQTNLSQLREQHRARPWLYSILRNAFLHRVRALKQNRCVSLEDTEDLSEALPDVLPDIDPEQLQLALNELPEGFRNVIVLYYFDDFSYRDIAEQMDLPIGTVMSRLARAKGYLKAKLASKSATLANGSSGSE